MGPTPSAGSTGVLVTPGSVDIHAHLYDHGRLIEPVEGVEDISGAASTRRSHSGWEDFAGYSAAADPFLASATSTPTAITEQARFSRWVRPPRRRSRRNGRPSTVAVGLYHPHQFIDGRPLIAVGGPRPPSLDEG